MRYKIMFCFFILLFVGRTVNAFPLEKDVGALELYGFARLNAVYDLNHELGGPAQEGSFKRLLSPSESVVGFSANQSRLGLRVSQESGLKVRVEGDFYNGDLRLRHAYGEFNSWRIGQFWSNTTGFFSLSPMLDFNGVAGNMGLSKRVPQIRYSTEIFKFSIEDPVTVVNGQSMSSKFPAGTVRIDRESDRFGVSLAGIVKANRISSLGISESKIAWGYFLGGSYFLNEKLEVRSALNYSEGANSYLYQSNADDAYIDENGQLQNLSGYGGSLGVSYGLGEKQSINMSAGLVNVDWEDAEQKNLSEAKRNWNVLLNYSWYPIEEVLMGVEVSHWSTELVSGQSEKALRLMYSAQYTF